MLHAGDKLAGPVGHRITDRLSPAQGETAQGPGHSGPSRVPPERKHGLSAHFSLCLGGCWWGREVFHVAFRTSPAQPGQCLQEPHRYWSGLGTWEPSGAGCMICLPWHPGTQHRGWQLEGSDQQTMSGHFSASIIPHCPTGGD